MEVDPRSRDAKVNYHFLTSAVAPRPIAWVTTRDPDTGLVNAAPFSWYQAVCADPPMLLLAINRRADGSLKDTARNIHASREFVVNVAPRAVLESMVASSADFPPEVSEISELGLETTPSRVVQAPRLTVSPVHFECRLAQEIPLGNKQAVTLVLGEVVHLAADDAVLDARGNVDPSKLAFLGRLGGSEYMDTSHHFTAKRPGPPGSKATGELP